MTKFVGSRVKTYSYLIDDGSEDKKAKGTKMCVINRKLKFENQENCTNIVFIRNKKSILKTQQRFKSERHNVFTEEIIKIALSSNDEKRMQSIDLIKTHAYGASKDLVSEKEVIKCNTIIIIKKKMLKFDILKEIIKEHNPNWSQIPDHSYRILIIGCSGSGKTNPLFNLINQQPDIDNIDLYAKYPYEAKYHFLINK